MKVNVYDTENVQKGRLMLLNIAEDLKDCCKVTLSPMKEDAKPSVKGEKKPEGFDAMKEAIEVET